MQGAPLAGRKIREVFAEVALMVEHLTCNQGVAGSTPVLGSNMTEFILVALMGVITVCAYIGYVPQIIRLLKTKESKDLSIPSWIIWIISTTCGSIYSIILKRPEMVVMYISELTLSAIILYFIIKYRKK